jgi:AcrR family transcriptional regulator
VIEVDLGGVQAAFLARGYDGATMEDLALALGMPLDALERRYPTKYDVWYAALCQASDDLCTSATGRLTAPTALGRIAQACRAAIEFGLERPDSYRFLSMPRGAVMGVPDSPAPGIIQFWGALRRLARQCIREGAVAPASADLVAQGIMAVVTGTVELQLNVHRIEWSRDLTDHVIATHIRGLAAPSGRDGT